MTIRPAQLGPQGAQPPTRVRGFTLVEVTAAITVLAIMALISVNLIFTGMQAFQDENARAQLNMELSSGLEQLSAELRQIDRVTGPAPNITALSSTSITCSINGVTKSFSFATNQISMTEASTTSVLADGVTSLTFAAFDRSNGAIVLPISTLAGAANIQRISISLSGTRASRADSLTTRVFLRNLMSGAQ